jgi:hypothetical protein
VVEHSGADDLAAGGVEGRQRQQAALLGERGKLLQRGGELFAAERGQVAGVAQLRVADAGRSASTSSSDGRRRTTSPARMAAGGTDKRAAPLASGSAMRAR